MFFNLGFILIGLTLLAIFLIWDGNRRINKGKVQLGFVEMFIGIAQLAAQAIAFL
jgi:hypothetical protein